MADNSKISWTDATWNPTVGCTIVSPGCTNCYAMKMAYRIKRMNPDPDNHYFGITKVVNGNAVWTGQVNVAPDRILLQPLKWKKPRRIFVNSMSDLFHESVSDDVIDKVFAVMALCPQHTFQILTKRSKRMREYCDNADRWRECKVMLECELIGRGHDHNLSGCKTGWPLPNVWLGLSCEDQARADERIPDLLTTPAAVRFVSAEPLLGPIDFTNHDPTGIHKEMKSHGWSSVWKNNGIGRAWLDQIIVGGESGQGFRPMQIEWAENIMRQCKHAGTAFFFKQDSALKPGQRGCASDELWNSKQMPKQGGPTL